MTLLPGSVTDVERTGLTLSVNGDGVSAQSADAGVVWSAPWDGIDRLSADERSVLADGAPAVVVAVTDAERVGRSFLVPASHPGGLEASIAKIARRREVDGAVHDRSLPIVAVLAVVAASGAAVAALLLAAGHVVTL